MDGIEQAGGEGVAALGTPEPRPFRRLAPEQVVVETLVSRIVATVLSLGAVVALTLTYVAGELSMGWWSVLAGAALVLVAGLWTLAKVWPPLEHRYAGYRVGPDAFELKRGVVWRSVASVPRARIQHTDVTQGPLQRSYGLATLVIYTAGTSYSKLELAGLPHAEALRIRDELLAAEEAPAAARDARSELVDAAWIEAGASGPPAKEPDGRE
jgi:hypothetical protein